MKVFINRKKKKKKNRVGGRCNFNFFFGSIQM